MPNKAPLYMNEIVATTQALKNISAESGLSVELILKIAQLQQSRQQTQLLVRIADALEEPQC